MSSTRTTPWSRSMHPLSWLGVVGYGALLFGVPGLLGIKELRFVPVAMALGAFVLGLAGSIASVMSGRTRPRRIGVWIGAIALAAGAAFPFFREGLPLDRTYALDRFSLLVSALIAWLGGSALVATGFGRGAKRVLPRLLIAAFLLHFVSGLVLWLSGQQVRMAGFVVQPNYFATLSTALVLPALLAFVQSARKTARNRVIAAVTLLALLVVLLASGSRAALLLGGSFVLIGIVGLRGQWIRSLALAAAVVVAFVLAVPNPLRERLERDIDRSFPRSFIWRQAAEIAADNPLGVGLRMHEFYFAQRAFVPEEPSLSHRRHEIGLAHNVILGATAEAGWLGGFGVILLIGSVIALARRRERLRSPWARGAYAGALLLILHAQVDGVVQSPAALGGLCVLLGFADSKILRRSPRSRPVAASSAWHAVACVVVVAVVFLPSVSSYRAGVALRLGGEALAAGDLAAARAAFEHSLEIVPGNPGGWLGLAAIARRDFDRNGDPSALLEIDRCCEALARANRFDTRGDRMSAELRRNAHFREERRDGSLLLAAVRRLDRALEADPLDIGSRFLRARTLILLGMSGRAASDLVEVLRIEPSHPLAYLTLGEIDLAAGRKVEARARFEQAMGAYFRANEILSTGRYGPLPELTEVVIGFRPIDCQRKLLEASRP